MALLFMDGFDSYANNADIGERYNNASNFSVVTGRTGNAVANGIVSANAYASCIRGTVSGASFVVGFAFKITSAQASTTAIFAFFDSATFQVDLRINSSNQLVVTRNGTTLGTSVSSLPLNSWMHIQWKVTIANSISSNSCIVKVNDVEWINLAAATDTQNTANASANEFGICGNSNSATFNFDDFYLCDQSGSVNNDFLGDCKVMTVVPSGDGANSGWTPSTGTTHSALVDESSPNDDTDYVSTTSSGAIDTYAFADVTSATVKGVQVVLHARKDDAGSSSIQAVARPGSTNNVGSTTHALSTSYRFYTQLWETNPDTSSAWTASEVNAAEFGVKNV